MSAPSSERIPPWSVALLAEMPKLPPIGMLVDFAALFTQTVMIVGEIPMPFVPPRLQGALRSYEDHVLGRLRAAPNFERMKDQFVSLSVQHRGRALVLFVQRFLERIGFVEGQECQAGQLREAMRMPLGELVEMGTKALNAPGDPAEGLALAFEDLVRKSRRCAALVVPSDLFFMEHIGVLGDYSERLFIQQLAEVQAEFAAGLPRRLPAKRSSLQAQISTQSAAEEEYPAGGFSSISTSGALENLVISELIYMEDPEPGRASEVDLFDLRYAEGELLYYTRDDSVFHREQRLVQMVLLPSLTSARQKDEGSRWQRLVTAMGLLYCVVEKLVDVLGGETGLQFQIGFVQKDGQHPLLAEQKVLALLLDDWVSRGLVEVCAVDSYRSLVSSLEQMAVGREVDWIEFGCNEQERSAALPKEFQVAHLDLGGSKPVLQWRHQRGETLEREVEIEQWKGWQAVALRLLSEMV